LRRDVFNSLGTLVLPKSHLLRARDVEKLVAHGIWLEERDIGDIDEEQAALRALEESVSSIGDIFRDVRHTGKIPVADIRNDILPAIFHSSERVRVVPLLVSMQAKDDYTYRHNIAVAAIASMLGRWLGLSNSEMSMLSIGAVLHDVGKMLVPEEILNKKDKLTDEEYEIMKQHTLFGYEMVKNTEGLSHRSALIALQHHEREDGTGYPNRLGSEQIDRLSKIVAVSDVFHALTSDRVYRNSSPFHEILRMMFTGALGVFDRKILLLFTKRLMDSLLGCSVELSDGTIGQVVLIPPSDPTRPLIRLGNEYLDLTKEPHLHMERIIG